MNWHRCVGWEIQTQAGSKTTSSNNRAEPKPFCLVVPYAGYGWETTIWICRAWTRQTFRQGLIQVTSPSNVTSMRLNQTLTRPTRHQTQTRGLTQQSQRTWLTNCQTTWFEHSSSTSGRTQSETKSSSFCAHLATRVATSQRWTTTFRVCWSGRLPRARRTWWTKSRTCSRTTICIRQQPDQTSPWSTMATGIEPTSRAWTSYRNRLIHWSSSSNLFTVTTSSSSTSWRLIRPNNGKQKKSSRSFGQQNPTGSCLHSLIQTSRCGTGWWRCQFTRASRKTRWLGHSHTITTTSKQRALTWSTDSTTSVGPEPSNNTSNRFQRLWVLVRRREGCSSQTEIHRRLTDLAASVTRLAGSSGTCGT